MAPHGGARWFGGLASLCLLLTLVCWTPAHASAPPTPWDGVNPFHCTVQNAGKGTAVPHPSADPYCVSFDKTGQNVSQLGLIDFLSKEPARVASAAPKCFYFQEDHWRGSLVQSDGSTVLYEFSGHYFFDKATGDGGVWVTGFSLAGRTFDPASLPGFPPAEGQYFGPGTGGLITHDQVPADPACVAKARANPAAIYNSAATAPRCVSGGGRINRRALGPLTLGVSEDQVRAALGPPRTVKRGFLRYCVAGGGSLLVGQPGDRSGAFGPAGHARTVMLMTTSAGFRLHGARRQTLRVGSTLAALRRAVRHLLAVGHGGRYSVMRGGNLIALVAHRRVVALGIYDRGAVHGRRALLDYLRRAR